MTTEVLSPVFPSHKPLVHRSYPEQVAFSTEEMTRGVRAQHCCQPLQCPQLPLGPARAGHPRTPAPVK